MIESMTLRSYSVNFCLPTSVTDSSSYDAMQRVVSRLLGSTYRLMRPSSTMSRILFIILLFGMMCFSGRTLLSCAFALALSSLTEGWAMRRSMPSPFR